MSCGRFVIQAPAPQVLRIEARERIGPAGPPGTPASAFQLGELADVDLSGLENGQSLFRLGDDWVNLAALTAEQIGAMIDGVEGALSVGLAGKSDVGHTHALWQGGPSLASLDSAVELREAASLLSAGEISTLLASLAPFSGARTTGVLPCWDGAGNLVGSGLSDDGTKIIPSRRFSGFPGLIYGANDQAWHGNVASAAGNWAWNSPSGGFYTWLVAGNIVTFMDSHSLRVGPYVGGSDTRRIESIDSAALQYRATHTNGAYRVDWGCDGSGHAVVAPSDSSNAKLILRGPSGSLTTLALEAGGSDQAHLQFSWNDATLTLENLAEGPTKLKTGALTFLEQSNNDTILRAYLGMQFCASEIAFLDTSGGVPRGYWTADGLSVGGNFTANCPLQLLSSTTWQQEWTHTAGAYYARRQVDGSGSVRESCTGRCWYWDGPSGLDTGLVLVLGSSAPYFGLLGATSTGSLRSYAGNPIIAWNNGLGLYGAAPVAQSAPIGDATDATDVIYRFNELLAYLRTRGDIAPA